VPLAYSPLVTPEEWHAANAVGQEHPACWTRVTAEEYLFHSGMVRCADHDRSMFGSQEKGGRRRYRCARKLPMGGRTSHGITAADLEERVWDTVRGAMLDTGRMVAAAEALAREAETGTEDVARRRAQIAARLERASLPSHM
jgi:hypothetical protein